MNLLHSENVSCLSFPVGTVPIRKNETIKMHKTLSLPVALYVYEYASISNGKLQTANIGGYGAEEDVRDKLGKNERKMGK